MNDFEFLSPTCFAFGRNAERRTGSLVKACGGTNVLLHFGGGSVKANGVYDKVVASLDSAGVRYVPLGGVRPNPRERLVREGIDVVRREKIDFILAVGGGSVIDSAKAIAAGAVYDGDFRDFTFGKDCKRPPVVARALGVGVVLTIAAAGSEGSCNCVISLEPNNLKRTITGDVLRPCFAVMNPEFTCSLGAYQTACGLVDIFAHVVERYFTQTADVRVTDELCEGLMRTIVAESAVVMKDSHDYASRANIMWAGTLAHNNVCGVGRVQDWASHGIEHELSALYDCAHGAGLAVVMPAWMEFVMPFGVGRFARFAEKVWGVAPGDECAMAVEGIARYRAWLESIGMPTSFVALGAKAEDIPLLAANLGLRDGQTLGAFRPLATADVEAILRIAAR